MFLYLLKYGAWINTILKDFDQHQKNENESTTTDEITTQTILTTTTEILPDYYDTDLYDETSKRPIRCKNSDRTDWYINRQNNADRHDGGPMAMLVLSSLVVIAAALST